MEASSRSPILVKQVFIFVYAVMFVLDDRYNFNLLVLGVTLSTFFFFLRPGDIVSPYIAWFFLSLLIGVGLSLYALDFQFSNVLITNRMRKVLLMYTFGISSYFFFRKLQLKEFWLLLDISFALFTLGFIAEWIWYQNLGIGIRVSSTFSEPSAAGIFYCFATPLCFYKSLKEDKLRIPWYRVLFIVFGFLVFSKSQVITILALVFISLRPIHKIVFLTVSTFTIWFLVDKYLEAYDTQIGQVLNFFNQFSRLGFDALSNEYKVWDTWITRINGIRLGIGNFIAHPWGNGFGQFSSDFIQNFAVSDDTVSQGEFKELTSGQRLPTPKSNLIEYLYSVGVVGVIFLINCFRNIKRSKNKVFLYSFYGLIVSSFFAELAFTMVYLFFLLALIRVETNENEMLGSLIAE